MLRHDIAIANVAAYRTFVGQGFDALFNVTVTNQGDIPETFNFTVYANDTAIETHTVTYLLSGLNRSTTFTWNTTGLAYGNYTISTVASPVPVETDTADNNYTCWVIITLVGDITGQGGSPDWNVDMKDVSYVARRFLCLQSDPLWDSNADVNGDGKVDMKDISIPARHFGEQYP